MNFSSENLIPIILSQALSVCVALHSPSRTLRKSSSGIYISRPEQRTRHTSHRTRFWVEFGALDMTSWTLFNESMNERDHTDIKSSHVDLSHKTLNPRSLITHKMFQRYFGRIVRHRSSPTGHKNQVNRSLRTGQNEDYTVLVVKSRKI